MHTHSCIHVSTCIHAWITHVCMHSCIHTVHMNNTCSTGSRKLGSMQLFMSSATEHATVNERCNSLPLSYVGTTVLAQRAPKVQFCTHVTGVWPRIHRGIFIFLLSNCSRLLHMYRIKCSGWKIFIWVFELCDESRRQSRDTLDLQINSWLKTVFTRNFSVPD